jgi:hypothetical protein
MYPAADVDAYVARTESTIAELRAALEAALKRAAEAEARVTIETGVPTESSAPAAVGNVDAEPADPFANFIDRLHNDR